MITGKRWLVAAALSVLAAPGASAEVLAICRASKGWAYYVPGGASPIKSPEWTEDSIDSGGFQLIRSDDDYDLVFTDATQRTMSAKADGASTIGTVTEAGDVMLMVLYPKLVETYVFWLSLPEPVVSFSQAKFASLIPKHSLMVAPCRAVNRPNNK